MGDGLVGFVAAGPVAPESTKAVGEYSSANYVTAPAGALDFTAVGSNEITLGCSPSYSIGSSSITQSEWRIAALGVRARYTGTELDRAGTIYCYESPGNDGVDGGGTISSFMSSLYTRTYPMTREWVSATWRPQRQADYNYLQTNYTKGDLITDRVTPLLILFGGLADGDSFEWEIAIHWEITAANSGLVTPPDVDVEGQASVSAAASKFYTERVKPSVAELVKSANDYLKTSMPDIASLAIRGAANLARRRYRGNGFTYPRDNGQVVVTTRGDL